MFVIQISFLIVKFFTLNHEFVINANYQRSQPTPLHSTICQYVHLLLLLLLRLVECVHCGCHRCDTTEFRVYKQFDAVK